MKKCKIEKLSRFQLLLLIIAAVAVITLLLNTIGVIFYAFGPISHPGAYEYKIAVTGLTQYSGNKTSNISIPLPVNTDNIPIFYEQDIDNRTFGIWTSRLVTGGGSTMIQFSTAEENLTDIYAWFYREEKRDSDRYRDLAEKMHPIIENTPTPYTRWIYNQSVQEGPVTLVVIGSGLKSHEGHSNLTFDLEFYAGGGVVCSQSRDWYRLSIAEDIPGGMTGSVPVRVQTGKHVNNQWIPISTR